MIKFLIQIETSEGWESYNEKPISKEEMLKEVKNLKEGGMVNLMIIPISSPSNKD